MTKAWIISTEKTSIVVFNKKDRDRFKEMLSLDERCESASINIDKIEIEDGAFKIKKHSIAKIFSSKKKHHSKGRDRTAALDRYKSFIFGGNPNDPDSFC